MIFYNPIKQALKIFKKANVQGMLERLLWI